MWFPIEFQRTQGPYDFVSPLVNLAGNGLIMAAAALAVAAVANFILKAFGYNALSPFALASIPLSVGVGLAGLGICTLVAVLVAFNHTMGQR